MKHKKIIHILPSNGIGGAEIAATSSKGIKNQYYSLFIKFLYKPSINNPFQTIFCILESLKTTVEIIKCQPNVIIVSLWKSCLSAIFIKLFRPKTKIILFIHLPNSVHLIDYFSNFIVSKLANQIWGDSDFSLKARYKELCINKKKKSQVISFLTYKLVQNTSYINEPSFIFWGRFHRQKRIDLAIHFFKNVSSKVKNAKFTIIGQDCGELKYLIKLTKKLQLDKKINFLSPKNIIEISELSKKATFYLQLSRFEGLAMSVVESMQLGLIPIVTDVGEIKNYCTHLNNALIYEDIISTTNQVIKLLEDPTQMRYLRENAISSWSRKFTYREDMTNSLTKFIKTNK